MIDESLPQQRPGAGHPVVREAQSPENYNPLAKQKAAAKLSRIPVKIELTREECFTASRTRHSFDIKGKMGVSRDGTIKAYELDVKSNTGGYASHGHSIASAAANKIPYIYPRLAFGYKALTFYSNLPNAGAMRGYGAPQATFALESLVEEAAQKLGMDSVDFRLKNVAQLGDCNPVNKKEIKSCGITECLTRGREMFGWDKRRAACLAQSGPIRRGVGVDSLDSFHLCHCDHGVDGAAVAPRRQSLRRKCRQQQGQDQFFHDVLTELAISWTIS